MTDKAGKFAQFTNPEPGEEQVIMLILEDNGDRVLVEYISDYLINPTQTIRTSEIFLIES